MSIGINTKSTIAYFKHETTPGTAVLPTSDTDGYFAVSEGPSVDSSKEVLDSDLISEYIGRAKGQHGLQEASGGCSFEWRHSGTEGTAPDFDAIVETALGGTTVNATEYDTVAASTTTVINVDTGEGSNFEVGQFLLVKDSVNDYAIRPIKSIASDALTIEPALDNAPGASVNLGKCILYKGENSDHKHGTFGLYHGNKNRERAIGALVETLTLTIETGQIIKAEVAFSGLSTDYINGVAPHSPSLMSGEGLVGLDVECWIAGTKVDFKSGTLTISNEIKEVLSAKEGSGKVSSRVGARSTEVAIMLYADDANVDNEDKYQDLTDFAFVLVAGKKDSSGDYEAGKCMGVYMPNCYFAELPRGEEDNILVENAVVRAHRSTGLNEIFLGFV